jgi:GH25 family lysozyme M1 (1,4-beta-N-acetylmuramidase)
MYKIPDCSFYQADPPKMIDFDKMRTQTPAVILRAGQRNYIDRDFVYNWQAAKAAGLARGSYFFYDSREAPKRQAEKFVSAFDGDFGELPMWCDFEEKYNGAYGGWRNWYDFMENIKILTSHPLGVYTGYYYFEENAHGQTYFGQYPLWIARYNAPVPLVPSVWQDWALWQYTDNGDGTQYGVHSLNIDLNYCKLEVPEVGNLPTMTLDANFSGKVVRYEHR